MELVHTENKEWGTQLVVDGEALGFRLEEKARREKYIPTPAEQKELDRDSWYRYRLPDDKFFPSGHLSLKLETGYGSGLRSTWADGKQQRVEKCLNKFIATAYKAAAHQKAGRIRHEKEERERKEQRRRNEILRREIEKEQKITQAQAEAEALRLQKAVISPELIQLRQIEMQIMAIEKWNGVMPEATSGMPFIDVTPSKLD